jgi:thiazole synthase ThiGH ThiG subunit
MYVLVQVAALSGLFRLSSKVNDMSFVVGAGLNSTEPTAQAMEGRRTAVVVAAAVAAGRPRKADGLGIVALGSKLLRTSSF